MTAGRRRAASFVRPAKNRRVLGRDITAGFVVQCHVVQLQPVGVGARQAKNSKVTC